MKPDPAFEIAGRVGSAKALEVLVDASTRLHTCCDNLQTVSRRREAAKYISDFDGLLDSVAAGGIDEVDAFSKTIEWLPRNVCSAEAYCARDLRNAALVCLAMDHVEPRREARVVSDVVPDKAAADRW